VLDRGEVGSAATAAAMGHIVVMDDSEAQFALTRYSQQLWRALRPSLPPDVEYEQRGTIWVAADEEELEEVRRKKSFYDRHGVPCEVLSPAELQQLEPNLRSGLAGGLLVPEDAVIDPPSAARFLMDRARSGGAELLLGQPVTALEENEVVLHDGTKLLANKIVNAAGVWAAEITPGIKIKKRKGHLAITGCYSGFVHHQLVELGYLKSAHATVADSVAFNVQPRKSGQVLVGSSRQYGAEHKGVDEEILNRMMRRAQEYMPALGQMSVVRTWTGFRAATGDKLPLIGPLRPGSDLFLATGHEGLGITTSLATGRLIADQVIGRASQIPVEPYWPSRMVTGQVHTSSVPPLDRSVR